MLVLISMRAIFWVSLGHVFGQVLNLVDFFATGLVRRTMEWEPFSSAIHRIHLATNLEIATSVLAAEVFLFVIYGGLVYFAAGYVARLAWIRRKLNQGSVTELGN